MPGFIGKEKRDGATVLAPRYLSGQGLNKWMRGGAGGRYENCLIHTRSIHTMLTLAQTGYRNEPTDLALWSPALGVDTSTGAEESTPEDFFSPESSAVMVCERSSGPLTVNPCLP